MNTAAYRDAWFKATSELPWGVQRVLHDTLTLVGEGKVKLVHSADYSNGSPCLVNAVGQMLTAGGGNGIPTAYFGPLVGLFDSINRHFQSVPGYNASGDLVVSPGVGEILVQWFAPLKEQPLEAMVDEATQMEAFANHVYVEPKDEDIMRDWLNAVEKEAQIEVTMSEKTDERIS